jgi:rod shape-determining protein MreC
VFSPIGDTWNGAFASGDLQKENDDLRAQIDELQGQVTANEAAASELEDLRREMQLSFDTGTTELVRAEVVSGPLSNFDKSIQINKGSSSGIEVDMPVVSSKGLVGTVVTVSDNRATVKLITDRDFKVGVSVAGAPGKGVVEGQGDDARVVASGFDTGTDLQPDNVLVTSGGDRSAFQSGIPVGTITSVATDDTTQQKTADVSLLANMNDLTYVTVVLYHVPEDPQ